MINRSTIKYNLKKVVPSFIFSIILFLWQKMLLGLVEFFDKIRLKDFTKTKLVRLNNKGREFLLYISPSNGFIDNYIFLYGVYESFILDIIHEHLKPGMTFVDIGANIGQHSMYAASIIGKKGAVYSFEPIHHIYEQLLSSSKINNFDSIIHANNFAIGEKDETQTLFTSNENIGGSSLVNKENIGNKIEVKIKNGDSILIQIPKIDMIKIDVEGYEYEVLSSIKQSLIKSKPKMLIEFSGYFYEKQNSGNGIKIISLLKEIGYKIYDIEDNMREVKNNELFISLFKSKIKQTNLLCINHK